MNIAKALPRMGITAKLLLINIFIFFIFGSIFIVTFLSFRNIEDLLTNTIVGDVSENMENAGLLRDLSSVFADTGLLSSTFSRHEEFLKTKGAELISTTKAIEQKSTNSKLKVSLEDFSSKLGAVLEQDAYINTVLRQSDAVQKELGSNLSSLEKIVSKKKIELVMAGEDPTFMEQVAALLSGYRESFLHINNNFIRIGSERISGRGSGSGSDKELLTQLDDLTLRFQTLTASEPGIAAYGPKLSANAAAYKSDIIRFFGAMDELRKRFAELDDAKSKVIVVMKNIDENIAKSTAGMRSNISGIIHSARTYILVASAGGLIFFGALSFLSVLYNIRKPMEAIKERIETIREGDLDARVELNRQDEWGVIENALNRMASDLKSSYDDLRDKNSELETTHNALREKVRELTVHVEVRKQLEDQLRQAQKMEAIGTLAGGVAHDFNNILTAITGYGSLLKMKIRDEDPLRAYVDHILTSSEKAASLTQGLLAFSRKQVITPKPVDVNDIVRNIEKLLQRVIGEDIELVTTLADQQLTILADRGQMEQVLMNLAANARDSMPDGGILSITTERVHFSNEFVSEYEYKEPGEFVLLAVSDTGSGIDESTQLRIFEPFFTTKEVGKGTGLGLAMVYGIIKQHDGTINVYSEVGKGTVFKIYLPLIERTLIETDDRGRVEPMKGGTETVLVAEDNSLVRGFIKDTLERFGYTVIEASDGEDAIVKLKENKDTVQLLIIDVIMPKKDGKETYEEIRKIRPDIKALFSSGYSGSIISRRGVLEGGIDFISKPVSVAELLTKIRDILDK